MLISTDMRQAHQRMLWKNALILLTLVLLLGSAFPPHVNADQSVRTGTTQKTMMAYHWFVTSWKRGIGSPICELYVAENRIPVAQDISNACGENIGREWLKTPPCDQAMKGGDTSKCKGLFVWYDGIKQGQVIVNIPLPEATIDVKTGSCEPGKWCDVRPTLRFEGVEPLEEYKIVGISVRIGESVRDCQADACELRMPITGSDGIIMEYWADSDYGDESAHKFLTFRNVQSTTSTSLYRIDLLNENWRSYLPPGALTWKIFPAIDDPVSDLFSQPASAADLRTDNKLYYLAGNLIYSGKVDVGPCQSSGLMSNGMASACGMEVAHSLSVEYQNKYDDRIFAAAAEYNVPARILKGIIAQETQFWPHGYPTKELGFGRITENGADMLLSWNLIYYAQVCDSYYGIDRCAPGYYNMNPTEKSMLRGLALKNVGTDAEFSLLAATLQASVQQVKQMMINTTGMDEEYGSTYIDLWKVTIANYHSGSGCVGTAMQTAKTKKKAMLWENISQYLLGDCQGAINYVDQVLMYSQ